MKQFVGRRSKDTVCEWLEFLKRKNIIFPSRVDSEIFTETRMFKNGIYVIARTRPFKAGCASVRCLAESDKPSGNHPVGGGPRSSPTPHPTFATQTFQNKYNRIWVNVFATSSHRPTHTHTKRLQINTHTHNDLIQ